MTARESSGAESDANFDSAELNSAGFEIAGFERLVAGFHSNPHFILGPHPTGDGRTVVRTFRPGAAGVDLVLGRDRAPMGQIHAGGIFEAILDGSFTSYGLDARYGETHTITDDPYRFPPTLSETDLRLISEGNHERLWEVLGAHPRSIDTGIGKVAGVSFAVWAPNARGVRVTGDFDSWSARELPMRRLGDSGVWEIFVPDVAAGSFYKFQIADAAGSWRAKADPMAFATEVPPATASVVFASKYRWHDHGWLRRRALIDWHAAPISIYEVHLGSWRPGLSYRELATQLIAHVRECAFTHVELLPVAEHPYGGSWGYQISSYYAPSARFGSPDDFRYLIDALHAAGIAVIVDWVPAHFPKDEWALGRFDGSALYEHANPHRGEQPDWGTYVFNFGRNEVRNFLIANALFWLTQFHVDGLRVDAVASMLYLDYSRAEGEWEPNEFGGRENLEAVALLQQMNAEVYRRVPGAITIAEESTAWPGVTRSADEGGLGFGFKWDLGWMHDTLGYLARDAVHRPFHHNELTFAMTYAYSEHFVLPLSHDEVVHEKRSLLNKISGDRWQQMATLRALYGYMWAHPGKQLLFMGQEFAQGGEWAEQRGLDWWLLDAPDHRGVARLVSDLNRTYRASPALWSLDGSPEGFAWIDADDAARSLYVFLRFGAEQPDAGGHTAMACVVNFASQPQEQYQLALPFAGRWDEVLNTDSTRYDGSGVGNLGSVSAESKPLGRFPASATIRVPPLATIWLRFHPGV